MANDDPDEPISQADDAPTTEPNPAQLNLYSRLVERVFFMHYRDGDTEVAWQKSDIDQAAKQLNVDPPKNVPDMVYTFRYRASLPQSIVAKAPSGKDWVILPNGRARYRFVRSELSLIKPTPGLAVTKVPDATPGMVAKYSLGDEQALLARLRYNRLIDIFTGVTCYSLQSHLRTTVLGSQVETDEIYIGVDHRGVHYVFPVQAKGGTDSISIVQVWQDWYLCKTKAVYAPLIRRPIAAQFMRDDAIALFAFEESDNEIGLAVSFERHYRLVPKEAVSEADLQLYLTRPLG